MKHLNPAELEIIDRNLGLANACAKYSTQMGMGGEDAPEAIGKKALRRANTMLTGDEPDKPTYAELTHQLAVAVELLGMSDMREIDDGSEQLLELEKFVEKCK